MSTFEYRRELLSAHKLGERSQAVYHATAYRGQVVENSNYSNNYSTGSTFSYPSGTPTVVSPSYCPSCQRNGQQSF